MKDKTIFELKIFVFLAYINENYPEILDEFFRSEEHKCEPKDLSLDSFVEAFKLLNKIEQ